MNERDTSGQDERVRGNSYSGFHTSGRAKLHAGSNFTNYNGSYYNYNVNLSPANELGTVQPVWQNHQPRSPSAQGASDGTTDSSPSHSSDATSSANSNAPAGSNSAYEVLKWPDRQDGRYTYFLDGEGLARHVVLRLVKHMAGPDAEVGRGTRDGRDGYLIKGYLLDGPQIAELRQQSRDYQKQRTVDRYLM